MRELRQVTSTGHRSAKRCRFYRVELLNGSNIGCGEKGRQIDGKGAKMAGAARVGKWRSKSNARGKYLLNGKAQNKQKQLKGWICGYNCEKWKHGESG